MEKLLDGVEMEWKTVDDIFHVKNGYTPSKKNNEFWTNGTVPWFRMEDIRTNGRILSDSIQHVSESAVKGGKYSPANSIIIATSATIGEHALITVPYLSNQRFTNLSLKKEYEEVLMPKFLYYYCFILDEWCKNNMTVGSFAGVDMNGFKKFQIPIPCPENPEKSLKIQAEIVRILDAFTSLTAELTAELSMRRKQYNYYRDQLLTFDEDEVEWKTLGEVGEVVRGNGLQKKDFKESGFPAIHYGQIYTRYGLEANGTFTFVSNELADKLKIADKNDLLIATTSENDEDVLKPVAWLGGEIAISGDMMMFKHKQNVKYLAYYFLTNAFQKAKIPFITGAKVRRISKDNLGKFPIPIPCPENPEKSLEIQAEIVSILDKFDTLTSSITEGLPREIELRQKQYEYYRDLLLTFPKEVEA